MEDSLIIELYFIRSEDAIKETDKKYRHYCENIGYHILKDHQDTEECIPSNDSTWDNYNSKLLSESIEKFLNLIPQKHCVVFMKRYFFCKSLKEISKECSLTITHVKVLLFRIRNALKRHLEMEDFQL